MKAKLENGTMKFYKTKEVEVEKLTPKEANKAFDAFTETLYDLVGEDEWVDVLKYIRDFSLEACENYHVKEEL